MIQTGRKRFGFFLKSARKSQGLSMNIAAARLGYISGGTISAIESGFASLPVEKLRPTADIYNIDMKDFLVELEQCEPELFEKYMTLRKQFEDEFMGNLRVVIGGRSSWIRAAVSSLRLPFQSALSLIGEVPRKVDIMQVYQPTHYILSE